MILKILHISSIKILAMFLVINKLKNITRNIFEKTEILDSIQKINYI